MVRLAALVLAGSVIMGAAVADWRMTSSSVTGSDYYVKRDDVRNETNNAPVVWVKVDARRNAKVKWRTSMTLYRMDCINRMSTPISTTLYDAAGNSISSTTFPPYEQRADPVVPDSVFEPVLDAVCPSKT